MKNNNIRKLNVSFNISGSGSTSTRISIPKVWIDELGITKEDSEVWAEFDGEKIVLKPSINQKNRTVKFDNNLVEYVCNHDDDWTFIWHSDGERKEEVLFKTGCFEEPPIEQFIEAHPYAADCKFEEF